MRGFERSPTLNLLRVFAVATLIASHAVVVLTEPQTDAARRYSQDGLEMDLPGDWQLVTDGYEPWGRTFRSAATGGEVDFIVMLPINASSYLGSLERFLNIEFAERERPKDMKRVQVGGLEAVSFSERRLGGVYRGQRITLEDRDTWIGVPDGDNFRTVFRFFTTVEPSDPRRKVQLMDYERMLASMRIDPVLLHRAQRR